jgi:hypothetical protein
MLSEWRARRALRARADAYVLRLFANPSEQDVQWLSLNGTGGDADHALWELRYAKRALGLLTAQRDALDDRTGSAVAAALGRALARDAAIAPGRLRTAERQLNARLHAYREALMAREGAGTGWHLGRTLLQFAGRKDASRPEVVARAADILASYLAEANGALREYFGVPRIAEGRNAEYGMRRAD